MHKIVIASWNVNGLRSIFSKGFEEWLNKDSPDIVGLQEIKAQEQDLGALLNNIKLRYDVFLHPAHKKGYSGTALLIKKSSTIRPLSIHLGLGIDKFDQEGRLIWAEYDSFIIINTYVPNGQRDHSRVSFKLEFSKHLVEFSLELQKKKNKEVIICGDINTAHTEIDLANPKANTKTTGFLPIERAFIDSMIEDGFVDIFRYLNPDKPNQYTWWTYRGDCRSRNIGWRLDYFFSTKGIIKRIINMEHKIEIQGSDHCPIMLELKV